MSEQSNPSIHMGTVKMVQSGDTVVIRGVPRGGPPPEKTLSLSGIIAPRLGRRPGAGTDEADSKNEPLAWECREFLRKKLVGQEVKFTSEYSAGTREYGTITLKSGENVAKSLVSAGLAKVRREEDADLMAAQDIARTIKIGLWGPPEMIAKTVQIQYNAGDPAAIVKKFAGKPVDAIIEHCRDGCNFRALLLPTMQSVPISLTGIKAPMFKRSNDPKGKDDPYASEAKYFVEVRLLQREIKLLLEGVSGPTAILATVLHPKGNISQLLLKEGYARVFDYSFTSVTSGQIEMRAAETEAKEKKLRIWKNYAAQELNIPAEDREYTATVVEIINPERIVVKRDDGKVTEVQLANVRKPSKPRKAKGEAGADEPPADKKTRSRPLYDVPFLLKSREFLREKLIDRPVKVTVAYVKPAEPPYPEKICVSLTSGSVDVGEALIGQGLATVIQHDFNRPANYDALLLAEHRANQQKKGVHSGKKDAVVKVFEITSNDTAARYVSSIQRAGRVDVVPEYVSSGSRCRVYIPKETCLATFMLAGITVPRTGFKGSADEPFSKEALEFVKSKIIQRTAQIEVLGTDKNGNLIGNMYLNGENIAESLLRQGLGEVHFSASRHGVESVLRSAENAAKDAKINMWASYDPTAVTEAEGDSVATTGKQKFEQVLVSEVTGPKTFFAQKVAKADELTELMAKIAAATPEAAEDPRKNKLYAAKFSDGSWYRAKITGTIEKHKKYEILYIDYGNTEETDIANIGVLSDEFKEPAPYATKMSLAVLDTPPADYEEEATGVLAEGILNQVYNCSVEYTDDDGTYVTLVNEETKDNVAMTMLSLGYARVGRTRERHLRDTETEYKKIQAQASLDHVGMWIYGDISEDPKDI